MRYRIVAYGNEALRKKAVPIPEITDEIRGLARDMMAAMYASNGLGLAAEQIGRNEAICIVDVPPDHDVCEKDGTRQNPDVPMPLVLANPRIIAESGEETGSEGCLSFPDVFVDVKRSAEVDVEYTDLAGELCSVHVRGLVARAVQHELDHLDGVLLVDRMSPAQRVAFSGRLKRIKKEEQARPPAD